MGTLDTMYQNGMPGLASYSLGQQQASDQAMAAAKLRAQQLDNDNAATMNPLNAQFRQGQLAQQQAELPGIVGQSQTQASQGQTEAATTGAKIAQRLSSLSGQIGVDGMQKMGREGAIASQAAQMLSTYPPALQAEVLPKIIAQYGGDPNSPTIQGVLKMPPEQIQKSLASLGEGMALASTDYLQKKALNDAEYKSKMDITDTNAAKDIYIAKLNNQTKQAVAQTRAAAVKNMNMDQKFTYLSSIPQEERTPEEQAQLTMISQQRLSERAAGANAVAPNVLGQVTPTANAQATGAQITGGTPKAAPSAAPDIQAALQKAGMQYEPTKYDYRVGPNGQIQRKAK